jgi:hypothetical protein
MARPKFLYHYTSIHHMPAIIDSGFLEVTESNASFKMENAAPQVVWLTADTFYKPPKYLGSNVDKTAIRIVVPSTGAQRADKWLRGHGATQSTITILEESGGGHRASSWYVVPRRIYRNEWIRVEYRLGRKWVVVNAR